MDGNEGIHVFGPRVADPSFVAWLKKERAQCEGVLTDAIDLVQVHRAQGRLRLLKELLRSMGKD